MFLIFCSDRGAEDNKPHPAFRLPGRRHQRGENGGQQTSGEILWSEEGTEVNIASSILEERMEASRHLVKSFGQKKGQR